MDLPKPPQEVELRNIIDKLAQFVARNGLEFEQMTKNKQKDNPKFSFLFGGEHFNYYQYKVTTEQAILKQKSGRENQNLAIAAAAAAAAAVAVPTLTTAAIAPLIITNPPTTTTTTTTSSTPLTLAAAVTAAQWLAAAQQQQQHAGITVEQIMLQQATLQEQIRQSEQNLAAQHTVLMQQQQTQIEEALRKSQQEALQHLAEEVGLGTPEFDTVLQPIVDSCTKDSISSGKGWILIRSTSPKADQVIALHLLKKVVNPAATFTQKLHIIYLVNDVLHHCARKNADDLKKALESVVVPMFCNSSIGISEEQQNKLNKLLTLWESKSNYLDSQIVEKLRTPARSWSEYQAGLISQHAASISPITVTTKQMFESYRTQHTTFVQHAMQQIQTLEQQKQAIEQQVVAPVTNPVPAAQTLLTNQLPVVVPPQQQQQQPQQQQQQQQLPPQATPTSPIVPNETAPHPPHSLTCLPPHTLSPVVSTMAMPPQHGPPTAEINFSQPPPGYVPGGFVPGLELPDLSKPPPGFPLPPVTSQTLSDAHLDELMPSCPYFDLPAGLMVPLIKLEDGEYKPLDPDTIRLPPPAPPSERLLAAVEAFYSPPCHDRPRDSEGWEKLGLYEYYRAKNAARKKKEDDIAGGVRDRSQSISPIVRARSRSRSPPRKRYRSRSRSRSRSKSRSSSGSPPTRPVLQNIRNNIRKSPNAKPKRRSSKSRSRSLSPGGKQNQPRSPERSPTPPSFMGSTYSKTEAQRQLDENNKGHQMLRKMGWGGAGLGAKEQGIEQPISGGEVRDRVDMYKGVGINLNDPYENFRKSKGQAFINRMKARAEERL